jgi:diguanylate cyclase (GGDEF)-like protein/PAS domain S-box-containing protein
MSEEGWLHRFAADALAIVRKKRSPDRDDRAASVAFDALKQMPDRYAYLAEFGPIIPWIALPNGTIIDVGPRGLQKLGFATAEALRTQWSCAIHTADREALQRAWLVANEGACALNIECRIRLADGQHRWFHVRATAQRDPGGQIVRWCGTAEDCDERRCATDKLRASEERYRLATKATNDVVWDWNFDTGQLTWGEAMCSQLGHALSPETSHGDWWKAQIHPDDRARVTASIEDTIKTGSSERWRESYRFRRGDGQYADIVDCGFVVTDESGKATRMVGAMMDLTERNRAAAALHLSEERYRYTIELGEQIAWTASPDGATTEVGPGWSQLTGRPPEEALDLRFFSSVHPDDVTRLRNVWQRSVATGDPLDCIYRLILHDRSFRWMRTRGAPLRNDAGAILRWYGTIEDVHEQRLAELDVAWRASHDVLTELANRETFQNCLEVALQQAAEQGGAAAVIIFDIDRFKLINDRYGHAAGDTVLCWTAERLTTLQFGTPARLGGDEFAVLLQGADPVGIEQKAQSVFSALHGVVDVDDVGIECQVSAGLAIYSCHGATAEELLRSADLALYDAKASGRNCLRLFRPELRAELQRHVSMLAVGREALSAQRIRSCYR